MGVETSADILNIPPILRIDGEMEIMIYNKDKNIFKFLRLGVT